MAFYGSFQADESDTQLVWLAMQNRPINASSVMASHKARYFTCLQVRRSKIFSLPRAKTEKQQGACVGAGVFIGAVIVINPSTTLHSSL